MRVFAFISSNLLDWLLWLGFFVFIGLMIAWGIVTIAVLAWCFKVSLVYGLAAALGIEVLPFVIVIELIANH